MLRRSLGLIVVLASLAGPAAAPAAAAPRPGVQIFLIALGSGRVTAGSIGCGDHLQGVILPTVHSRAPLRAAMRALLGGHHRFYGQSGLYNALWQSRLSLAGITIRGGHGRIRLTGQTRLGGECDAPRVMAQLRATARQFASVQSVSFTLNGRALGPLLGGRG